jgi:hypothetical protein
MGAPVCVAVKAPAPAHEGLSGTIWPVAAGPMLQPHCKLWNKSGKGKKTMRVQVFGQTHEAAIAAFL